jgi:formylglycine-generating enzyme required for sulfatase activity
MSDPPTAGSSSHSASTRCASLTFVALLVLASGCERRTAKADTLAAAVVQQAPSAPCPEEMALVTFKGGRVCIDKYEGAVEGSRYSHPLDGVTASTLHATPAKGVRPQVNISEIQAEAACDGASKRLCTSREWIAACRGPEGHLYPYGNEHAAGACNEGRPSPVQAVLGSAGGRLDDPRLAEQDVGIAAGGAFENCVTASGVYDMHGNVHEWVSDSSKPSDPRFGMFLGGFFADGSENGAGCAYRTTAHFKEYHDYSTGFRCCRDAN